MIGNAGTMRLQATDFNSSFLIFFLYGLRFVFWELRNSNRVGGI